MPNTVTGPNLNDIPATSNAVKAGVTDAGLGLRAAAAGVGVDLRAATSVADAGLRAVVPGAGVGLHATLPADGVLLPLGLTYACALPLLVST